MKKMFIPVLLAFVFLTNFANAQPVPPEINLTNFANAQPVPPEINLTTVVDDLVKKGAVLVPSTQTIILKKKEFKGNAIVCLSADNKEFSVSVVTDENLGSSVDLGSIYKRVEGIVFYCDPKGYFRYLGIATEKK